MTRHGTRAVGLALILIGLVVSGCAATRSATDTVGGWFGRTPTAGPDSSIRPHAYYAASTRVAIHASPDASSKVVAELARHEGVLRYQIENGFAYVIAAKGDRAGWVLERALIARVPAAQAVAPKPAAPAESVPPAEPEPSAPEGVGEPSAPAPTPEKSIFDPY